MKRRSRLPGLRDVLQIPLTPINYLSCARLLLVVSAKCESVWSGPILRSGFRGWVVCSRFVLERISVRGRGVRSTQPVAHGGERSWWSTGFRCCSACFLAPASIAPRHHASRSNHQPTRWRRQTPGVVRYREVMVEARTVEAHTMEPVLSCGNGIIAGEQPAALSWH